MTTLKDSIHIPPSSQPPINTAAATAAASTDATTAPNGSTAQQQEQKIAISLLHDVFRRVDANDDGQLSFEEFRNYFNDGTVSLEHLYSLFATIDTDASGHIDVNELTNYFKNNSRFGAFAKAFHGLHVLNEAINESLLLSSQQYQNQNALDQFATRFLMSQLLEQIHALETPLQHACGALRDQALKEVGIAPKSESSKSQMKSDSQGGFSQQVERLSSLINQLENRLLLNAADDSEVVEDADPLSYVVRRMDVYRDSKTAFFNCTQEYLEASKLDGGYIHCQVSVKSDDPSKPYLSVVIYEVWRDEACMERHFDSVHSREHRTHIQQQVRGLEQANITSIPKSWWVPKI